MTWKKTPEEGQHAEEQTLRPEPLTHSSSPSSGSTITPDRLRTPAAVSIESADRSAKERARGPATGQVAGLVGMFTGVGALIALSLFLPLPARLQKGGTSPADAVADSFYIVGAIALVVGIVCFFGLRGLNGEEKKGWKNLVGRGSDNDTTSVLPSRKAASYTHLLSQSFRLCFTDASIGLGCLGGFVARASSVGISLFIPLFVNHYFISSGLCKSEPHSAPSDIKEKCRRAYTLAAALSGVSQLVALLSAPIFGYLESRFRRFNIPLMVAAVAGVTGYVMLARLKSPDPKSEDGSSAVFLIMALLGISQIGSIVCSLSLIGRGIQAGENGDSGVVINADEETSLPPDSGSTTNDNVEESSSLLPKSETSQSSRSHLKGSIAGWYSLAGGAGILLLTKLGGQLFDSTSTGAPFYMLAAFNGFLLAVGLGCGVVDAIRKPY